MLAMSNAGAQVNNLAATNDITSGLNFITNTTSLLETIDQNNNLEEYINLLSAIKSKIKTDPIYTFTASSVEQGKTNIKFDFESSGNNIEIQNTSYSKNNDKYVVYAGRISTEKGVEDLIESFLRSELNNFRLKT